MSSPAGENPSSGSGPAPADLTRRVPRAYVVAVASLAANLAFFAPRDDRVFVAFAHLNLLLLFWCARRLDLAPPGSAARARTRLAVWLLTASLSAAFTWRMCAPLPAPLAVAAWAVAAAIVGGRFYSLFLRDAR